MYLELDSDFILESAIVLGVGESHLLKFAALIYLILIWSHLPKCPSYGPIEWIIVMIFKNYSNETRINEWKDHRQYFERNQKPNSGRVCDG